MREVRVQWQGAVKVTITSSVDILAERGILPRNFPAPDVLWRHSEQQQQQQQQKLTLKLRYGNGSEKKKQFSCFRSFSHIYFSMKCDRHHLCAYQLTVTVVTTVGTVVTTVTMGTVVTAVMYWCTLPISSWYHYFMILISGSNQKNWLPWWWLLKKVNSYSVFFHNINLLQYCWKSESSVCKQTNKMLQSYKFTVQLYTFSIHITRITVHAPN